MACKMWLTGREGKVGRLVEAVVLWVVHGDGQDLVVLLAAVHHRHQADGTGVDQRQRRDRFLA